MEILSKLVGRQVFLLCVSFPIYSSTTTESSCAKAECGYVLCGCLYVMLSLLSVGLENAEIVGGISEVCITDTATFISCFVTGIILSSTSYLISFLHVS